MALPKIKDEFATIHAIIDSGASLARFGDGELKLCIGGNQILQVGSPRIATRLREVLHSDDPRLLVGVPRLIPHSAKMWQRFLRQPRFARLYRKGKQYHSAFISRPDSAPGIDHPEYWELVKQIWRGRNVVLLRGRNCAFCHEADFLEGAASVEEVRGPSRDAFDRYNTLFALMHTYLESTLLLLSLGPTATVLAADLSAAGHQALDVGHIGLFYDGTHPKSARGRRAAVEADQ
jgi:hypothetical protein